MNYTLTKNTRNILFGMMGLGVVGLIYAFVAGIEGQRIWANLLVNGLFFTFIALAGTLFVAIQYASEAGWSAGVKRVPEAMGQYLPIGGLVILIVLAGSAFHVNHIYHWMDDYLVTEKTTVQDLRTYEEGLQHHATHAEHHDAAAPAAEGHGHDAPHAEATPAADHYVSEAKFPVGPEHDLYAANYEKAAATDSIANPHFDEIIAGKSGYLNKPFFFARSIIYLAIWIFFTWFFRKRSLAEDLAGDEVKHRKNMNAAGWFLVFFAVTSSTMAWDWVMSVDPHWFSTLFGWYVFAGMFVTGLTMITLISIHLKRNGYFQHINENHFHDLGKFMFGVSVFWTYLWTSQFLLIWYANIPEEVTYFQDRWENYKVLWVANLVINFIFPFLVLMSRDAKRNISFLMVAGVAIICGHWLDVYLMIMPGTVKANYGIGLLEIGMFVGFAGLFGYVTLNALTKASLVAKNHPFVDESAHHHI